ncbi:MAG: prepilin-type cleavage/methylation domain-containing protein [Sideroxydans sp.]|nr:prepilin-type cleavage/methylation domain-containing protein [Sideroxydans sp.]
MPANNNFSAGYSQKGVVIVETLIAILIFSIGILGIIGMQANMIKNTAESKYRAEACYIAKTTIGAMWSDASPVSNLDNHVGTDDISNLLPGGTRNVKQTGVITDENGITIGGQFTVTINWQAPGEPQHSFVTVANIAI